MQMSTYQSCGIMITMTWVCRACAGPITSLQKLQRAGQTLYLAAERTVADR